MKAVIYTRVSTEDQAKEGVSLSAQLHKARAYCTAMDLEIVGEYTDEGISGAKGISHRPGLAVAMKSACTQGAALVVYSLSRLSRSTALTIELGAELEKAGADLVSLSERIDTTSAAGKMIFRMLAVMAEFERDQVSERTASAMAHKKAKGERVGTIPYGWELGADGVHLVKVAAEQSVLRRIESLHQAGASYSAIARELKALGIATKNGGQWHPQTIKNLLRETA